MGTADPTAGLRVPIPRPQFPRFDALRLKLEQVLTTGFHSLTFQLFSTNSEISKISNHEKNKSNNSMGE